MRGGVPSTHLPPKPREAVSANGFIILISVIFLVDFVYNANFASSLFAMDFRNYL